MVARGATMAASRSLREALASPGYHWRFIKLIQALELTGGWKQGNRCFYILIQRTVESKRCTYYPASSWKDDATEGH